MRLMRVIPAFLLFYFFSVPCLALANGFATSENFIVYADTQELAEKILAKAEEYREKLATEWFGRAFPDGAGVTIIHARINKEGHVAVSTPKTTERQHYHYITMRTTEELMLGGTLAHEMSHILFAQAFGRIPRWMDEGAACFWDDTDRCLKLRAQIADFAQSKKAWPDLRTVVGQVGVTPDEAAFYAASKYFVMYLLEIGTKEEFMEFARDLRNSRDFDRVVREHYPAIRSFADLESRWRAWAARLPAAYPCAPSRR